MENKKQETRGSKGRCGLCHKTIKTGEEFHFQVISNNPNNILKERQHWDCENTKWSPFSEEKKELIEAVRKEAKNQGIKFLGASCIKLL